MPQIQAVTVEYNDVTSPPLNTTNVQKAIQGLVSYVVDHDQRIGDNLGAITTLLTTVGSDPSPQLDTVLYRVGTNEGDITTLLAAVGISAGDPPPVSLLSSVNENATAIGNVDNQVSDLDTRTTKLGEELGKHETKIKDVSNQVSDLNTQVTSNEGKLGGIETRLDDINTKISALETSIADFETRITRLEGMAP